MRAKPGEFKISWGRVERVAAPSLIYSHGGEGASRPDGHMMSYIFEGEKNEYGRTLAQDLVYRGYDISTLKFSIKQQASAITGAKP
jgi:hypothetical protein